MISTAHTAEPRCAVRLCHPECADSLDRLRDRRSTQGTPLPLPPRSFGIMVIGRNATLILGLQSLTGKILITDELANPVASAIGAGRSADDLGVRLWIARSDVTGWFPVESGGVLGVPPLQKGASRIEAILHSKRRLAVPTKSLLKRSSTSDQVVTV